LLLSSLKTYLFCSSFFQNGDIPSTIFIMSDIQIKINSYWLIFDSHSDKQANRISVRSIYYTFLEYPILNLMFPISRQRLNMDRYVEFLNQKKFYYKNMIYHIRLLVLYWTEDESITCHPEWSFGKSSRCIQHSFHKYQGLKQTKKAVSAISSGLKCETRNS
jgi:hypothetical protein